VYRWVEHTGELELEIEAATERAVFEDGLAAMRELLETEPGEGASTRVSLAAPDRATLLAEWLGELAFVAESEGLVPERLASLDLEATSLDAVSLDAVVEGYRGEPPHLVKAVTYHRLSFDRADGGWRATVILDV
jgi:SHS2 domain-containing protein